MIPVILVPILMGAFWTIVAVGLLSLFCFLEFSRATGFFREKRMSLLVILGINALTFAALDKWYHLFVALTPIVIVVIAAVSTSLDQPHGYIQRVAARVSQLLALRHLPGPPGLHRQQQFLSLALAAPDLQRPDERRVRLRGGEVDRRAETGPAHQPQQDHLGLAGRDRADDAADLLA